MLYLDRRGLGEVIHHTLICKQRRYDFPDLGDLGADHDHVRRILLFLSRLIRRYKSRLQQTLPHRALAVLLVPRL